MRAFITGVSGQDGGYLADRLLAESGEVHGVIRSWDDDAVLLRDRHPEVHFHVVDLTAPAALSALVEEIAPTEVYNLAGISSVAQSWRDPVTTSLVNGAAVAALLEGARRVAASGVDVRVLQASSAEIFGTPPHSPQNEETPLDPTSPYGASKAYAHRLVGLERTRGLHASTVILYNHESPRRPESFVTRKITAGVARIAAGTQDVLALGDTSVERDWGWAPDYVDAMVRAVRHDRPDDYVIATGESHSVREFVEVAFAAAGLGDPGERLHVDAAEFRPTEIARMRGDASRARRELGWEPTVRFAELVERMVEEDLRRVGRQGPR